MKGRKSNVSVRHRSRECSCGTMLNSSAFAERSNATISTRLRSCLVYAILPPSCKARCALMFMIKSDTHNICSENLKCLASTKIFEPDRSPQQHSTTQSPLAMLVEVSHPCTRSTITPSRYLRIFARAVAFAGPHVGAGPFVPYAS